MHQPQPEAADPSEEFGEPEGLGLQALGGPVFRGFLLPNQRDGMSVIIQGCIIPLVRGTAEAQGEGGASRSEPA